MNKYRSFLFFVVVLCLHARQGSGEEAEFLCPMDASGRFLALERLGDGESRNAHVTVFEYLSGAEPQRLRKLYEAELLNKRLALVRKISQDGRFLVTLDDFTSSGTSPVTLVIYDLARKEHTAYAGKDFLDEDTIKALPHQGFLPGFKWWAKDADCDRDSTRFFPTRPERCEKERVPFIVVDLPTRMVRVMPTSSVEPNDIVSDPPPEWWWKPAPETTRNGGTALPSRLIQHREGAPSQVFQLRPSRMEYVVVGKRDSKAADENAARSKQSARTKNSSDQ
ncbi:MAG: hypothetical protein RIC55_17855 [Pirellulaceae bacterium]